jgi:predicted Fe-S protein YdhL (DUF1289 family)
MTPSPCIGFCQIDLATGLCLGCARTRSEIEGWAQMRSVERDAVWTELPQRRVGLGMFFHLLPGTVADLRAFVLETLRYSGGTWVSGVFGAVAEFCIGKGEPVCLENRTRALIARAAPSPFTSRTMSLPCLFLSPPGTT